MSDVWMYAVLISEIVNRKPPHMNKSNLDVGVSIRDEGLTPQITEKCPKILQKVLQGCWKMEPKERLTFADITDMLQQVDEEDDSPHSKSPHSSGQ